MDFAQGVGCRDTWDPWLCVVCLYRPAVLGDDSKEERCFGWAKYRGYVIPLVACVTLQLLTIFCNDPPFSNKKKKKMISNSRPSGRILCTDFMDVVGLY